MNLSQYKDALLHLLPVVGNYEELSIIRNIVKHLSDSTKALTDIELNFLKVWLKELDKTKRLHKDLLSLYESLVHETDKRP